MLWLNSGDKRKGDINMCLGKASGYIESKEQKATSLLKPYTNNDRINDMYMKLRGVKYG